ncbi:MAG: hypothetical protein K0U86_17190 [Planctomycetes bacterium]|nr:hypothetical protein [Planctomycetota bacterium]MCH9726639.1 hypothetical protein [Planctomycetota bacterium]MCH9779547.1 hypothetical protein [Planctomycetota bacterium]MCH9793164.1 hypothetical protein [Planctomycetota bacterium]MDF1743371.1 hypothetical protein [Gimesia sp.]
MSKLQLPLMSLVAAIPAGFLTYLLVMAFLNHAEAMSTTLLGVAGLTLLLSAVLTIIPIGALIFGPKGDSKKKEKSKGKDLGEADSAEADDDLVPDSAAELSDEFGVDEYETEEEDELASGDDLDFGESDEFSDSEISSEFEDDDFGFEEDDYEFDDEDEEDK